MFNTSVISKSLLIKLSAFSISIIFTIFAPIYFGDDYVDLISTLSFITVGTILCSYGSAGSIMRLYISAVRHKDLKSFVATTALIKCLVYGVVLLYFTISGELYIAVAIIMADLGLMGSLFYYAEEKYVMKQIYLPIQSFVKVLLMLFLHASLPIFILLLYFIPRIFFFSKLVLIVKNAIKERSNLKVDFNLPKFEIETYVGLLIFYSYLHSPILMGSDRITTDIDTNAFTFLFSAHLVVYALIATINELILPTAFKNKNNIKVLRGYSIYLPMCSVLFFCIVLITLYISQDIFRHIYDFTYTFKSILQTSTFFCISFSLNLLRQIFFVQNVSRIWNLTVVCCMIFGFFMSYGNLLSTYNSIIFSGVSAIFLIYIQILCVNYIWKE